MKTMPKNYACMITLIISFHVNVFPVSVAVVFSLSSFVFVSIFGTENNKHMPNKNPRIPVDKKGSVKPPKLYKAEPIAGPYV